MLEKSDFTICKDVLWMYFTVAEQNDKIEFVAEHFFNEVVGDIVAWAALVTVLNHKCWDLYEKHNNLSDLYSNLYYKYNDKVWDWLEENGTQEQRSWYFDIMD